MSGKASAAKSFSFHSGSGKAINGRGMGVVVGGKIEQEDQSMRGLLSRSQGSPRIMSYRPIFVTNTSMGAEDADVERWK